MKAYDQLSKLALALILQTLFLSIFSASAAHCQNSSQNVSATSKPTRTAWQADVQRRIKRAWFPPKGLENNPVTVQFVVHKDGNISDSKISKSSGVAIADSAAIKAVENAAPFRPLPDNSNESTIMQMTLDYNIFSGTSQNNLIQVK